MRQMTGIGSIQFDIRLKFCPMVSTCDIMQWYKNHIGLEWSLHGYINGPSLIDSCVSMKLSSTI